MSTLDLIISIVAAIAKAFMETYFADAKIAEEASAKARAEGAAETAQVIAGVADVQAHIAVDPAPDAGALARRLRERAAAASDGSG